MMKPTARRPDPAAIIETVIEALLSDGADLKTVTLAEFKRRMTQAIRSLSAGSKATAA